MPLPSANGHPFGQQGFCYLKSSGFVNLDGHTTTLIDGAFRPPMQHLPARGVCCTATQGCTAARDNVVSSLVSKSASVSQTSQQVKSAGQASQCHTKTLFSQVSKCHTKILPVKPARVSGCLVPAAISARKASAAEVRTYAHLLTLTA